MTASTPSREYHPGPALSGRDPAEGSVAFDGSAMMAFVTDTAYLVPAADLLTYWPHDLLAPNDVPVIGPLREQ
jgi:hypothetical protein